MEYSTRGRRSIRGVALVAITGVLLALTTAVGSASEPDSAGSPDPGWKRYAPAVDLEDYPKIPVDRDRGIPVEDVGGHTAEVVTKAPLAGGGYTVTTYDLPVGVTPEQGAARLRAEGHRNVEVVDHDEVGAMGADDCSLGVARTNGCPPAFWSNNGFDDPQVRFNDHTGANWPVNASVSKWNQTPGIDSYYLWNSCPFKAGARCVDVRSANYGASGWQGRTTLSFPYGNSRIGEAGAVVELNDYRNAGLGYSSPFSHIACHELGHALGLDHNVGSTGCMTASGSGSTLVSDERNLLASVYSIYRGP